MCHLGGSGFEISKGGKTFSRGTPPPPPKETLRSIFSLPYSNSSYLGGGGSQLSEGDSSCFSKVAKLQGSCLVSHSGHCSLRSCHHLTSRLEEGGGRRAGKGVRGVRGRREGRE